MDPTVEIPLADGRHVTVRGDREFIEALVLRLATGHPVDEPFESFKSVMDSSRATADWQRLLLAAYWRERRHPESGWRMPELVALVREARNDKRCLQNPWDALNKAKKAPGSGLPNPAVEKDPDTRLQRLTDAAREFVRRRLLGATEGAEPPRPDRVGSDDAADPDVDE